MWPRVVELALGCWLILSPYIFAVRRPIDLAAGTIVAILSLCSFWRPLGWSHAITLLVAFALGVFAYFQPREPVTQNEFTIALLLTTFAILPNEVNLPPRAWRKTKGGDYCGGVR